MISRQKGKFLLNRFTWMLFAGFLVSFSLIAFTQNPISKENSTPVVRIIMPVDNSIFRWNTAVRYSISVLDIEDGNSEYDEIGNNEVVLHIRYVPDYTKAGYRRKEVMENEPKAITLMKTNTCFNCHSQQAKLIGPSYDCIAERYTDNEKTLYVLESKIRMGSVNSWGEVKMPAQPDLKPEEAKEIVRWILQSSQYPNEFYQVGLTGSFPAKEKISDKGVYILTASYIDHGLADKPHLKKRGQHTIVLKPDY